MHEGLTGEITLPSIHRNVPCPTLVDPPRLFPFLRREHDFPAYAAPAIVTPAHKETPPHGSRNGSFHKPRQRSGGLADHGVRVSRQAAPRLWSEHVWPHMRRLLSPYPFQGSGMIALIAPLLTSSALAATTCCIFIIHQESGDQFGRWTSCWFRRQSGLRRFFCGTPIAKSMVPGVLIPFQPRGRPFPHIPTKRTRCSARSVTQGAASTLFWCRPCRHSLP